MRPYVCQTDHRVAVILRYEVVRLPYFSGAEQKFVVLLSFLPGFLEKSASMRKIVWLVCGFCPRQKEKKACIALG